MKRFKHQKKAIIKDFKSGKEYVLKSARYPKKRRECRGGCQPSGIPRFHDSGEEAMYCEKLQILQKVGAIRSYETQKTFYLKNAAGEQCASMRVDFIVTRLDGSKYVAEYKGALFQTLREFVLLRALFSWNYPDFEYQTITQKDLL